MRIFITGGTGFIGSALIDALVARGDRVVAVSRNPADTRPRFEPAGAAVEVIEGDPRYAGDWQARVAGCDAVINMAGESVGRRRWNSRVRQALHDSRTDSTHQIVAALAAAGDDRPRVLVNASGIDYYGVDIDVRAGALDDDDSVDESAPVGEHFLARVCADWEAEAMDAEKYGVRVVLMRTGLVVGGQGSLMTRWETAFRLFAGGRLSNGRQWMSWIHLEDAVGAYLFALDTDTLRGPVNLVAPDRLRNTEFARQLGASLGRPSWIPAPAFALRLILGGFADCLLHGRPAVPAALLRAGYGFRRAKPFA